VKLIDLDENAPAGHIRGSHEELLAQTSLHLSKIKSEFCNIAKEERNVFHRNTKI